MKKMSQRALRVNRKKSREGSEKRKPKPSKQPPKPLTPVKRDKTLDGNQFESCFQPDGRLDHDRALWESIGRKYGIPNLSTRHYGDDLAAIKAGEMFYWVEILLCSPNQGSGAWWWDLIYNFRDDELNDDRRFAGALLHYRPEEHPEHFASPERATEVFHKVLEMKDKSWMTTPDGAAEMRLRGCWVMGSVPDSPMEFEIEGWVANADDSHQTLKMQRQMALMIEASGEDLMPSNLLH